MSAKLFKVGIAFDICVVAGSEGEAIGVAEDHAAEELGNRAVRDSIAHVREVAAVGDIDGEWEDAIPYYADDIEGAEETCRAFLEGVGAETRADADLPGQGLLSGEGAKSDG